MSNPNLLAEEQLLELLLQLKKTTPESARAILNSQPQIAYALITLMVNINAINVDVLQKTVAAFGASQVQQQPAPALPPHMQAPYHTPTPPSLAPPPPVASLYPYSNGHTQPAPAFGHPPPASSGPAFGQVPPAAATTGFGLGHTTQSPSFHAQPQPSYPTPPPAQPATNFSALPDALAGIPDDQKAIIMRVISMTPEQINQLPLQERTNVIQLRTTLGLQST